MVIEALKTSLIQGGRFPWKLLGVTLLLRTVDLFLVQSSFVPDEYWQSLEVAHRDVFGYGHKTWEWDKGVRSYIYVSLVALLYRVLKLLQVDSGAAVVWAPRILQGVLSAVSDVYFVRWVHERRCRQHSWAFLSWITAYFVSYTSTRTLLNTLEMNLTTIALYYYPWSPKRNNLVFLSLVTVLFFIRPTSAVVWLPLVFFNVLSVRNRIWYVTTTYLPVVLTVGAFCTALDCYLYDRLVFTPWEFFSYNVLRNIGEFYGVHDFFWYFYAGIPAVMGIQFVPFYYNTYQILGAYLRMKRRVKYNTEFQVTVTALWSVLVYSLVPHKELRFLLPLMPVMLFVSSDIWSRWSARAKILHIYIAGFAMIVCNFCALLFLGQFHQTGALEAMRHLSKEASENNKTSILFLTPCHSFPLYSHLHADIPARFLTCEPDFERSSYHIDEAEQFFNNSQAWMKREYYGKQACNLPTHVVSYDSLNITNFLHMNKYNLSASFFDSYIYGERRGEYIKIHKRKPVSCQ